jgi:hypothetical protein
MTPASPTAFQLPDEFVRGKTREYRKVGGSQKLTCAVTALDSKSKTETRNFAPRRLVREMGLRAGLRGTSRDFAGLRGTSRDFAGLRGTSLDFAGLRGTFYYYRGFDVSVFDLLDYLHDNTGNQLVEYSNEVY